VDYTVTISVELVEVKEKPDCVVFVLDPSLVVPVPPLEVLEVVEVAGTATD